METARASLVGAFSAEPEGWGPSTVFHILRDVLSDKTVATADSGAHRILLSQIWHCPTPRTLLQSSGLCTMGCALPLGAGHKRTEPDTPVVVFVGDAGLEMGLGELATLRDLKLAVIVVVLVDASLALIELKQRAGQRSNAGVDFGETDFVAVAKALGGVGAWVDDAESLRLEAEAALSRDTFTILACRIMMGRSELKSREAAQGASSTQIARTAMALMSANCALRPAPRRSRRK
ncbi:thiamine pyrophosphate-dependent enzyme [Breoghania sp.]|uniref:thiamine pyrophosphate-dependent enzyme n=1 Tax=Breoghania sp. TaxID=2065378 RepID=UPI0026263D73|nr:thiamine pyrophosphate-dependent enzyme [Breoghania sp.]MDJ0930041.1 thiamine pyrophosphate-dependent enzyme [Breoghania sp.]